MLSALACSHTFARRCKDVISFSQVPSPGLHPCLRSGGRVIRNIYEYLAGFFGDIFVIVTREIQSPTVCYRWASTPALCASRRSGVNPCASVGMFGLWEHTDVLQLEVSPSESGARRVDQEKDVFSRGSMSFDALGTNCRYREHFEVLAWNFQMLPV